MCESELRRALAIAHYKGPDASVIVKALDDEERVAEALKGRVTPHRHPVDILIDELLLGIEVKSVQISNRTYGQIHMNQRARELKRTYAKERGIQLYTVVVDHRASHERFYVRQGVGSFRLGAMREMSSLRAIRLYLLKQCASQVCDPSPVPVGILHAQAQAAATQPASCSRRFQS